MQALFSASSREVVAATGALPGYGIVGMSGVGKTVALLGLAHECAIRSRFPDGVLLMTLGQGATIETVIGLLVEIVTLTGATILVERLQFSTSLREAVDYAVPWFRG